MKKIILPFTLLFGLQSTAQLFIPLEELASEELGWIQVKKYTAPAKSIKVGNRTYSSAQIRNCELFIEWMQQSYLPTGCLGDAKYYVNELPGTSYESQQKNALPHLYGAYSRLYMFLKKDPKGKLVPQTGLSDYWRIEVNQLEHITNHVPFISTPDQYYFVMPHYDNAVKGHDFKKEFDFLGFSNHPNLAPYRHFYQQKNAGAGNQYVTILTANNKLPFEEVTIGEFLTRAEQQLPEWQKREKRSNELLAKALENLARIKEKYKSRWNDIARLHYPWGQIGFYDFVNANPGYNDMLDEEANTTSFPLMKISKATIDLCKTDQPQWIVIRWDQGLVNNSYAVHKMESILNNFNFAFVHDYFFNPEKLKSKTYSPLRSPLEKKQVVVTAASEETKKATADKSVFFFEDFSTTAIGNSSSNWTSNLTNGKKAIVTSLPGADGNWLELRGHAVTSSFKKPLPSNFELSYDVSVPKGFAWGGKRLDMVLMKENNSSPSSFRFSVRPGFDGREGESEMENNSAPGYENGTKYFKTPGFSNNLTANRVKIRIRKEGETIQVFVDENKITSIFKAIPASQVFNFLKFSQIGSDNETQKYFISNIRIIAL
jgi:hypothetical protein